jgi:parallel beta-helix repeat protein
MTFGKALSFISRAMALLALATAVHANQTYVGVFFDVGGIAAGGTAAFDMQLRENDGTAFSGGAITVTYPAGLVNDGQYGDPLITENCTSRGAIITRTAGTNQLIVTNVSLAAFDFCDIYVRITGSTFGSYTITIPPGSFSGTSPPTTNSATTSATLNVAGPVLVTNTADSGVGSLRDAINTVNANCGAATGAQFNIAGSGPFTISPNTELPILTCGGSFIDGWSQPGSVANSNPSGANNASIMIDLNGSACAGCNGLTLLAASIQVDGLAIHSFAGNGILSNPGSGTTAIYGNYIGTDASGMVQAGNGGSGIAVNSGYAVIGDNSAAGRNLVTANTSGGIVVVTGGAGIAGNQIGGLRDASVGVGNGFRGIYLSDANYSPDSVVNNLIITNGGAGIAVTPTTFTRVVIEGNQSYFNSGLGIDMNDDGATANDEAGPTYDTDSVQNYPVVTSVYQSGGNTIVSGYLKSVVNRPADVFLYHNTYFNSVTEGETQIDAFSLPLDATGYGTFTRTISGTWNNVTAQATLDTCGDGCQRSSEYSPKVAAGNPLVVTSSNDSGAGSLRAAIDFVNANCTGTDVITFNVPGGTANISVITPLSTITCDNLVIDAFTQPGSSSNTLANGDNAVRGVVLAGFDTSFGNGFTISARSVTIRGFEIWLFRFGAGIYVSTPLGLPGPNILGNIIGTDDFNQLETNQVGIQVGPGASGVVVGSPSNGDRNIISGNRAEGILLQSGDLSQIVNNYIGTNRQGSGSTPVPNARGISIAGTTNAQIIGNLISGNTNEGILIGDSTGTVIRGNRIGLNNSGFNLANGTDAISFNTAGAFGSVGGTNAITDGNKICSQRFGVHVASNGVSILGNSIVSCGGVQGIDLSNGGVAAANDSCDADGGANGWQNYPVITSALVNGSTTAITGTFDSTGGRTFRLEFFRNVAGTPPNGSARDFMGTVDVATTLVPSCATPFSVTLPFAASSLDLITATATDLSSGSTGWLAPQVATSVSAPAVSFSVPSIDFGVQLSSTISASQTLALINTGVATLNISSVGATAPFNIVSQTCGATLAPATSCTFDVTFEPTAPGTFTGNFTLVSDAPATPTATVPLIGVAMLPPTFALATGTTLTPNQVTTISIRVGNPSANPLAYSNFDVLLTYPAGYANDNPNASYPQGGCGDPSFTGGSPGGNTIGAAGGGSAAPGVTCSRAAAQVFAPSTPGTYTFTIPTGAFTITSPFTYTNPAPITVSATISPTPVPAVSLSTPAIAFGPQTVFTTSGPVPLVITNTGNATLNISSIFVSGDFGAAYTCALSIAPAGTCTVNVTFTPDIPGSIAGSLNILSDDPASPTTVVPLSGTGVALAPVVSLTPPALTFASRTVSTTSAPQTITLANTGNGPLAISSINVSGDFAFTSACPASLAALASCTIDVTFTPLVTGARTGNVMITDNAAGSPHLVPLGGTGVAGAAAVATVSPPALDYPAQPVGSSSVQQVLTVTNTGSSPLTITLVSVTGEFAIVTPASAGPPQCPATVLPGLSCRIAAIFNPRGPNLRQGVLTIVSDAGTLSVTIVGTGLLPEPPQLTMPSGLDFGSQPVGVTSSGRAIAMHNQSATTASVAELTATGDFDVSDTCATIAAGATCSPLVTFQPSALGPRSGTLTVRTLRDANPYVVNLTGIGIENLFPQLEVSAEFVGFGNAFIGEPVTKEVTLKNVGRQPLQVSGIDFTGDYFGDGACIGSILPATRARCT